MAASRMGSRLMAALLMAASASALLAGCRGDVSENRPRQFFPDFDDQPKYKAQAESTFFREYVSEDGLPYGRVERPPVPGTVAYGRHAMPGEFLGVDFARRQELLRPNEEEATGRRLVTEAGGSPRLDENGQPVFAYVERIPVPVDRGLLELGQKKFDIFCMPCHGMTGEGDGMVGRNWAYALPNFHDAKYQPGGELGQDGYIFHVIRNGVANPGGSWELKMPSYARKLSIEETWAVVSYFRALQVHRKGSPEMLPARMRQELERKRAGAGVSAPSGEEASS